MIFSAERIGDGENKATGRWRLNSGSEMILSVPALNKGKAVRAVIDIGSACFSAGRDRIVSLYNHDEERVVGFWDNSKFTTVIEADLHLVEPKNEIEAVAMKEAVQVAAQARAGVPIQVSVGAEPGANGQWVHIPPGESITCNGRSYSGDGDMPLYVLKGGEVYEASIVTFGADSVTGRIAARLHLPVHESETPMSDKLKVLLGKYPEKHHGLVARCVAESVDDATISDKIHAAELAEKDAEIARLTADLKAAKEAKTEEVAAKKKTEGTAAAKAKSAEKPVTFAESAETEAEEPKTLSDAMKVMIASGEKARGFELRAAAISKYPNVQRI